MEYIKSAYKNNKFKISDPTWNDEFDLPDGSYFLSDMKDYYEYIIKKHENIEDISPIEIYINKIKTRFVFKIKANYKLKLLSKEARKLRRSTEKVIVKDKNDEHVLKLETVIVILMHCNFVNSNYRQVSKISFTFVPDKQFGQLIIIAPHSLTMLKTMNAEFSFLEVWFTDQNNYHLKCKYNSNN